MARINSMTYTGATIDRDGICQAQVRTGAGALTLNGALVSGGVGTPSVPCKISFYSAGNLSALTFTITGTGHSGSSQSETVTGPNATTVLTTKTYKTVTAVSVSATIGTNVEVGSGNALHTQWYPLDTRQDTPGVTLAAIRSSDANFTYEEQECYETPGDDATGFAHATVTNKTANAAWTITGNPTAFRIHITSWVAGSLKVQIIPNK